MKFVITKNSVYVVTITKEGFKAVKVFAGRESLRVSIGDRFVSKHITLVVGEPMLIGDLVTSTVIDITDELPE